MQTPLLTSALMHVPLCSTASKDAVKSRLQVAADSIVFVFLFLIQYYYILLAAIQFIVLIPYILTQRLTSCFYLFIYFLVVI